MKKIFLSIIIPVYKVQDYLDRCLQSIVCQDLSHCEVILIDDGSPDDCGAICDKYASNHANVFSYHKENGGLSDARNFGIEKSSGEYLWFIDSDDYITNNSVKLLIEELKMKHCDVLVCQSKTINDNNEEADERIYNICRGIYTSRQYMEILRKYPESALFCAQLYICRKSFIDAISLRFYKGILHEDELWTPQLLIFASSINYSGYNIYFHYMRDGSIMHSSNMQQSGESDLIIAEKLLEIFNKSCRLDLLYLRDHMVNTYLQAVWKVQNFHELNQWRRIYPIRNSYYLKTKLKSLIFLASPRLYLCLHNLFKKIKICVFKGIILV